jgi:hypothetical protein
VFVWRRSERLFLARGPRSGSRVGFSLPFAIRLGTKRSTWVRLKPILPSDDEEKPLFAALEAVATGEGDRPHLRPDTILRRFRLEPPDAARLLDDLGVIHRDRRVVISPAGGLRLRLPWRGATDRDTRRPPRSLYKRKFSLSSKTILANCALLAPPDKKHQASYPREYEQLPPT